MTNILFIQPDQHRYDCVGANGHPFLQTPNLDRLAATALCMVCGRHNTCRASARYVETFTAGGITGAHDMIDKHSVMDDDVVRVFWKI